MPSYKITKDSVKTASGVTSFMVTFIRDDNTESAEQYYEVASADEKDIYAALDKAAEGFEALGAVVEEPVLEEDKPLEAGTKVSELEAV